MASGPTRPGSVSRRLPPWGFWGDSARQINHGTVDGQYRATGGGNSSHWTPTWTCNKCEVDTTDANRLTVVCGRRRADPDYPWIDTIILPDGTQIDKAAPDTVVVSHRPGDWGVVYYLVDSGASAATLQECAIGSLPAPTSTTWVVPVALVWVVWSDYKSAYRIRSVIQQKTDPIVLSSGGGGGYDGPWAVSQYSDTQVKVGANRSATKPCIAVIHPYNVIVTTPSSAITVTGSGGYIYVVCNRELYVPTVDAPAFGSFVSSTQAYNKYYVPLAYVVMADGVITAINQLQYGNILIHKTVECSCQAPPDEY